MGFENPVVGGTALRIPAIQSPDFQPGVAGWIVRNDGTAEFNGVVIRGATTTQGVVLMYNGTPAVGNLVVSIAPAAGTDSFGNAYLAGLTTYATDGSGLYTQMRPTGDLALGYGSVFPNAGLVSALAAGLQITTPTTNTAPNDDPAYLIMQPGGTTGADRGFVQFATTAGRDLSFNVYGSTVLNTQETTTIPLVADSVTGTTADLMSLRVNGGSKFTVDKTGKIVTYAANTLPTYTPAVSGGGSATFSTQTGWYQQMGKETFFTAYLVVNAAGSGASNVQIDAPVSIDRTTRQQVGVACEGLTAGNNGSCQAVAFTSGSGATFDRLRNSTGGNITGADLQAGAILTVEGRIRQT